MRHADIYAVSKLIFVWAAWPLTLDSWPLTHFKRLGRVPSVTFYTGLVPVIEK